LGEDAANKEYVDDEITDAIEAEQTAREEAIDDINSKIPNQATEENQLADKAFVNSSIQNMAARYITETADGDTQWASLDELNDTDNTHYYQGEATTPTNNDYAIFINTDNSVWRAAFDGVQWNEQYKVNDTPFTAAQLAVLASGITAALVAKITENEQKIADEETARTDADTALQTLIGTLSSLTTTDKTSVVNALNSVVTALGNKQDKLTATGNTNLLVAPATAGGQPAIKPISDFATAAQGAKADNSYQKPSGGIPAIDLDQVTQDKLKAIIADYKVSKVSIALAFANAGWYKLGQWGNITQSRFTLKFKSAWSSIREVEVSAPVQSRYSSSDLTETTAIATIRKLSNSDYGYWNNVKFMVCAVSIAEASELWVYFENNNIFAYMELETLANGNAMFTVSSNADILASRRTAQPSLADGWGRAYPVIDTTVAPNDMTLYKQASYRFNANT
jgi:hypothetical protein